MYSLCFVSFNYIAILLGHKFYIVLLFFKLITPQTNFVIISQIFTTFKEINFKKVQF